MRKTRGNCFAPSGLGSAYLFASFALFAALAVIVLLHYALAGPALGRIYDTLLKYRPEMPASREILLIETGDTVEQGDVFSVLTALSEMGASDALIETPVSEEGASNEGAEIIHHINDEFDLLVRNIRNLFEAIRLGLVPPAETAAYVDSLVDLAELGRDRIAAAVAGRQDGAAVFGSVRLAETHDGILRRIPLKTGDTEHCAYRALKPRWTESFIEQTRAGTALAIRFESRGEPAERRFPLDRNGNLLVEEPHDFRRLPLELFLDYDQADRALALALKDAGELGVYAETAPERIPFILHDYAGALREELLREPGEERHTAWVYARRDYLASLNEFLSSPSELISVELREKHREFSSVHAVLAGEINASLCIIAPAGSPSPSALLANALLCGRCITPARTLYSAALCAAASLIVLACIYALGFGRLRSGAFFCAGLAASALCGAAFGVSFVFTGYWVDPLIPAAACLGGTSVLTVFNLRAAHARKLLFKLAFAPSVPADMLKKLKKKGALLFSETTRAEAVIIAVKNTLLAPAEDTETPQIAARYAAEYRETVSRYFREAGAQMLAFEGDTAFACFGSPLERLCLAKGRDISVRQSAERAAQYVAALLGKPTAPLESPSPPGSGSLLSGCRIGIDAGECAFFWSPETGYTANGRAITRARIYASLAVRYRVKAIIGEPALKAAGVKARRLAALSGESFYAFEDRE